MDIVVLTWCGAHVPCGLDTLSPAYVGVSKRLATPPLQTTAFRTRLHLKIWLVNLRGMDWGIVVPLDGWKTGQVRGNTQDLQEVASQYQPIQIAWSIFWCCSYTAQTGDQKKLTGSSPTAPPNSVRALCSLLCVMHCFDLRLLLSYAHPPPGARGFAPTSRGQQQCI